MSSTSHASIIAGFSDVFHLCTQLRAALATLNSRITGAERLTGWSVDTDDAWVRLADLERTTSQMLRAYMDLASPLDESDPGDRVMDGGGQ